MSHEAKSSEGQEEQLLMRIADPELAEKLRKVLHKEDQFHSALQLKFEDASRLGTLLVGDETYAVTLLDLPTVVESYKTYDDINLVKTGDVGQMLLVGAQLEPNVTESPDGVTPPMRRARVRHFRQLPRVDPAVLAQVERDLLAILNGDAPEGMEFVDVEEEYVIDPATGAGSWKKVQPK